MADDDLANQMNQMNMTVDDDDTVVRTGGDGTIRGVFWCPVLESLLILVLPWLFSLFLSPSSRKHARASSSGGSMIWLLMWCDCGRGATEESKDNGMRLFIVHPSHREPKERDPPCVL